MLTHPFHEPVNKCFYGTIFNQHSTFRNLIPIYNSLQPLIRSVFWVILFNLLFSYAYCQTGFSCSPYEFEVVKLDPNAAQYPSNVTSGPSTFHCFYTVRLRLTDPNSQFSSSWNLNYLEFHGVVKVNKFTSYIDPVLTQQISASLDGAFGNPYLQYLDISGLKNGEVVWRAGEEADCQEPIETVTLPLPVGKKSVDLFTIVVAAAPGDYVNFYSLGGTVCIPSCSGAINVTNSSSLGVTFSAPPVCNPQVMVEIKETTSSVRLSNFNFAVVH